MSTDKLHVVCPHCDAVNRMPRARLADGGRCGSCRKALFDGRPVALDGARLARHARDSDIPLLVDLWAPWCGPCRAMAPELERAAARLEPGLRIAKVDIDQAQDVAARYAVRSVPTLLLLRGGREVARISGAMSAADLERWVAQQAA